MREENKELRTSMKQLLMCELNENEDVHFDGQRSDEVCEVILKLLFKEIKAKKKK